MRTASRDPRLQAITGLFTLAVVVAACSSAGSGAATTTPATSAAAAAATSSASTSGGGGYYGNDYGGASASPAASAAAAAQTYTLAIATGTVGSYLTGKDGLTLYTFKPDSANTSTCTGSCASNWPPFIVSASDTLKAGTGVAGTLATFARADGSMQVAYKGAPLYYYSGESKAGDTNGQGIASKWYVAAP